MDENPMLPGGREGPTPLGFFVTRPGWTILDATKDVLRRGNWERPRRKGRSSNRRGSCLHAMFTTSVGGTDYRTIPSCCPALPLLPFFA